MELREHLITAGLAAVFAIMIWFWAEGENRDEANTAATVSFVDATGSDQFRIRMLDPNEPSRLYRQRIMQVKLRGPNRRIRNITSPVFQIALKDLKDGEQRTVNLTNALQNVSRVVDEGLTIDSVEPDSVTIVVDELETRNVPISRDLPGIMTEELAIMPESIDVTTTRSMWEWIERELGGKFLFLDIDEDRLDALQPGDTFNRDDVRLRLSDAIEDREMVEFSPNPVEVKLTLDRKLGEVEESVPVKVGIPIRDTNRYEVTIDREFELINEVIISGDAAMLTKLQNREVKVFAMVNLSSDELEQGIARKRIEWMLPEGLSARMKNGERPFVPITIKPLAKVGEDAE